uniref:Uncharacterized protein n=1 Tax=Chromera velia CCMP2878 TaxID=1169474 RepID=A0A0G4HLE5_9ALVE|eukprot:Cvel_28708.t1-p1 / transcript=Cvel_28708.t1 / gene=Cvel_28708 / organism=Chromera_velia_CCMP2878 / gene_product=hypothetical protein / transcript_product=hypothetical protein / location=Cvel_scaffold3810:3230-4030(-) / protein_length=267 / sequence_SO=supercontig / SO=protein_coding / is_pseudo=false
MIHLADFNFENPLLILDLNFFRQFDFNWQELAPRPEDETRLIKILMGTGPAEVEGFTHWQLTPGIQLLHAQVSVLRRTDLSIDTHNFWVPTSSAILLQLPGVSAQGEVGRGSGRPNETFSSDSPSEPPSETGGQQPFSPRAPSSPDNSPTHSPKPVSEIGDLFDQQRGPCAREETSKGDMDMSIPVIAVPSDSEEGGAEDVNPYTMEVEVEQPAPSLPIATSMNGGSVPEETQETQPMQVEEQERSSPVHLPAQPIQEDEQPQATST